MASVAFYGVGSLLAAFAPTFGVLMLARIVTGAMYTTILVMFILAAMEIAEPDRKARTVGRITLGLGVATVIGVPTGALLAQTFGWRASFLMIATMIAITVALLLSALPRPGVANAVGLRSLGVITRIEVSGGVAMSARTALGVLALLAFIVPVLTESGVPSDWVAPALFVYGAACLVGNQFGAVLADRNLSGSIAATLALTCAALFFTAFSGQFAWSSGAALSLVGLAYFSTFPPLNTWVATASSDLAPALALSLNSRRSIWGLQQPVFLAVPCSSPECQPQGSP